MISLARVSGSIDESSKGVFYYPECCTDSFARERECKAWDIFPKNAKMANDCMVNYLIWHGCYSDQFPPSKAWLLVTYLTLKSTAVTVSHRSHGTAPTAPKVSPFGT